MRFRVFVCLPAILVCLFGASAARAETRKVATAVELQAAIDAAQPGDVIALDPNATYVGNFVLRNKGVLADYITIRSAADDMSLPPAGVRMTPAYTAFLPKIKSSNETSALRTEAGANHWKLMFLEFQANVNGYGDIIDLGAAGSTQTLLSQVPYALVLDRLYVHGDPVAGQKRGIALHSRDTDIVNSWVSECKAVGQEAQAISGFNGPGNYLIENNHLEGATQNFLIGGADPTIPNLVTSNITFRYNYLTKPPAWMDPIVAAPAGVAAAAAPGAGSLAAGTYSYTVQARGFAGQTNIATSRPSVEVSATLAPGTTGAVVISWKPVAGAQDYVVWGRTAGGETMNWKTAALSFTDTGAAGTTEKQTSATTWLVKNIFELKNAQHVLVEGNVFEYNWVGGQPGYAILFTPRNQGGTAPWVVVQDATFRYNIVRHTPGGVNILGTDNVAPSQRTNHIEVSNNVFDDVNSATWTTNPTSKPFAFQVGDGADAVKFDHNTTFTTDTTIVGFYGAATTGFVYTNNTSPYGNYGINGSGASPGLVAIAKYAPDGIITANVLAGGAASASKYPAGNCFPTMAEWYAGFKDYAHGDYHVLSGFAAKCPSLDGAPVGADIDKIDAMTGIGLSGDTRSNVSNPVAIVTTSLPKPTLNQPYDALLACTGGSGGCAWRQVVTSHLPAGISFDAQKGEVVGTPTAIESGVLMVEAYDPSDSRNVAPGTFALEVVAPELKMSFPTPPRGRVGVAYRLAPTVTGAVGATAWSVASGDQLPDGLGLDLVSGTIAGIPTKAGTWIATVQVKDSVARPAPLPSQTLTIVVDPAPPAIVADILPNARYGTMYAANLNATGGTPPFAWSANGTLPAGLIVNPSGTISGVPGVVGGPFNIGISLTDAAGATASAQFSLTIEPPDFTVQLPAVMSATVGQPFQVAATAVGNVGAVTWSIASGTLPPGLTLDKSSGAIAGTPTTQGQFSFTLQAAYVVDAAHRVFVAGARIDVAAAAALAHDVVLYASDAQVVGSAWSLVDDPTAAGGRRIANADLAAPKLAAALGSPASYFELTFQAQAGVPYHLWMRGKAQNNLWTNDSVYVQFSGSVDANGAPVHRISSTSAAALSIEDSSGAGLSGWGWADDLYGGVAQPVYFATTGAQTIRVQVREDGVSLDQIVLGADKYAATPPGATKNDATILDRTGGTFRNIVLYAADAKVNGAWSIVDDADAALGRRVANPDAKAAKVATPLASPADYFELTFTAEAGVPYHLWMRGKADGNSWMNDSVYVQFSGSVDAAGTPINQIGSTLGTSVSIEEASGAGLAGWGWADNLYGGLAAPFYFATTGPQTIRVQVREDGASFDQIVISADRYLTVAPGATKNDATIVPR